MKISNMTSSRGNVVPQQFIIHTSEATYFQSYGTIIVKIIDNNGVKIVFLDKDFWDYSSTTSKYRNKFLGETTKQIEENIKTGIYKLADLNS